MRMATLTRRAVTGLCMSSILCLVAGEPSGPPASPELIGILNEALVYEYDDLRSAALRAYESLGPRALPAIPVLTEKIRSATTSSEAEPFARAFLLLGDGVLPEVKKMIEAKETRTLIALAEAAVTVRAPKQVVELLADHPDPKISLVVRQRLPGNNFKAPSYIKAGGGQDSRTRLTTMQGLYGRVTEEYRDYMVAALGDPYPEVRMLALRLLGDLKPATQATADAVGRVLLDEEEDQVTFSAAQGLGSMGAPALPWLIKGLQSPRKRIRHACLNVMNRFGKEAAGALPVLRELAEKETANDKIYAVRAIACITGEQEPAIAKYLEALKYEDRIQVLREKARAKRRPGNMVRSPEEEQASQLYCERNEAIRELGKIGPPVADRVLPVLREALLEAKDLNGRPNDFADLSVHALPNFGPEGAKMLVEAFLNPLKVLSQRARMVALNEYKRGGTVLLEFARHPDPKAQLVAAEHVYAIPSEQIEPVVAALLQSKDREVRLKGLQAFVNCAREDLPVFGKHIVPLTQDPDAEVQKTALLLVQRHNLKADGGGAAVAGAANGLKAADPQSRLNAAVTLARQGQCPDAALPVFNEAFRGRTIAPADVGAVLAALRPSTRKPADLRSAILTYIKDANARQETLEAGLAVLAAWEPAATRENFLIQCMESPDRLEFRKAAARELGRGGAKALAQLVLIARTPQKYIRAQEVLGDGFKAAGPEALPKLVELMADSRVRNIASLALHDFGPAAVEKVRPLLNSTDADCVSSVLSLIEHARPSDPATLAALKQLWEKAPARLRPNVLRTWAACSTADPALHQALLRALLSDDQSLQLCAAQMASRIPVDLEKTVRSLAERLNAGGTRPAASTMAVLAALGEQALPCLETLVTSPDREVRKRAWESPAWRSLMALPVLGRLVQCADAETRESALAQLKQQLPLSVIVLGMALKNPDPVVRNFVLGALKPMGLAKPLLEKLP